MKKKYIDKLSNWRLLGIALVLGTIIYFMCLGIYVSFGCEAQYLPVNNISNATELKGFVC